MTGRMRRKLGDLSRRARQRFASWLLDGAHLDAGVSFGPNSVRIAGDKITFTSTVAPTAPGDLAMDVATGRPHGLLGGADAAVAFLPDLTASASTIIANWPLGAANRRVFLVDPSGNDGNVGYLDGGSSVFPISAITVAAVAKKTLAGLGNIIPRLGNARSAEIIIRSGTYTDDVSSLVNGLSGYAAQSPFVRGTDTAASAASVAFAGDLADVTFAGATTVAGMNVAGYSPSGAVSTTSVQCTKVGGAAPALPAPPLAPTGWRMRFDAACPTVALRNVCRGVAFVNGTDTVLPMSALPAVPRLASDPLGPDNFYLEQAGVVMPGATFTCGAAGSSGSSAGLQFVGILFSSNVNVVGSSVALAFCGAVGTFSTNTTGFYVRPTCSHPLATFLTVGGGLHATTIFCSRGGTADLHCVVSEGSTVFNELAFNNWKDGCVAGTGFIIEGTTGTDGPTVTSIGPAAVEGLMKCWILGSNPGGASGLFLGSCKVRVGAIDITGCGSRPAVLLNAAQVDQLTGSPLTGSSGNNDVGVGFGLGNNIWNNNGNSNSVTGAAGDIRTNDGLRVLSWAQVADGFFDRRSNTFIGTRSADGELFTTTNDLFPGFLSHKVVQGTNVVLDVLNPGADEQLRVSVPGAAPTGAASGDLGGTYPGPTVVALHAGATQLTIGAVADGQLLQRSGTTLVGVGAPAPTGTASGDLGGAYPGPTVVALHSGATQLTIGAVADGQVLGRSGTNIVGVSSLPPSGAASGDLGGAYPSPTVLGVHAAGVALTFGAVADGQVLVRSGATIVGATGLPPSGAAGGDLGGTYPNPTVVAIHETGGPARLAFSSIPDGQLLVRSGSTVQGFAPTAASVLFAGASGVASFDAANLAWDSAGHVLTAGAGVNPTTDNVGAVGSASKRWASVRGVQVRTDNVVVSASKINIGASSAAAVLGDVAMDTATGRPHVFVGGADQAVAVLSDVPTSLPPNGAAGGDLFGTYPNPAVAALHTVGGGGGSVRLGTGAIGLLQVLMRQGTNVVGVDPAGDLGGAYDAPTVVALHSGATQLTIGAVSDGDFLRRSGTSMVGQTPGNVADALGVVTIPYNFIATIGAGGGSAWLSAGSSASGVRIEYPISDATVDRSIKVYVVVESNTAGAAPTGNFKFVLTANGVDTGGVVTFNVLETGVKEISVAVLTHATDSWGVRVDWSGISAGSINVVARLLLVARA